MKTVYSKLKLFTFSLVIFYFLFGCSNELKGYTFDLFDETPLEELAEAAEEEDIEEIIRIGKNIKNINYREKKFGKTLLMLCVANYRIKSAEQLLKLGANPNLKSYSHDESAFMISCNYLSTITECDLKMVKLIHKYGGEVNKCQIDTNNGNWIYASPLMLSIPAYPENCMDISKYLIQNGAKIDTSFGKPNNCAVNHAVMMGQYELACYFIIDKKARLPEYFIILNEGEKNEKKYSLYEYLTTFDDDLIADFPECKKYRQKLINYLENVYKRDF